MDITQTPSPNFNMRKHKLDMLVLHYTGMATGEEALERMCDPAAEVSAHYMVWEDGRITQLVDEDKRAWHAGVASWQGQQDLNSRSIGIEIVNGGHDFPLPDGGLPPYPRPQIHALLDLVHDILGRHDIPASLTPEGALKAFEDRHRNSPGGVLRLNVKGVQGQVKFLKSGICK